MRIKPIKRYLNFGFLVILFLFTQDAFSQVCNVSGGQISTNDPTLICRKESGASPFTVTLVNSSGPFGKWLFTNQNGKILEIQNELPLNLDSFSQGVYSILHISYDEIALGIEEGNNITDISGCFDLSNNILVVIDEVKGGRITDDLGLEKRNVCTDRFPEINLNLVVEGSLGFNKRWILTDLDGRIETIQETGNFSFINTTNISKQIYHLSYASIENLFEGSQLTDLIGCFDLSNSYELILESNGSEAGILTTSSPSSICSGDGVNNFIELETTGNNPQNNLLVLTDLNDFIINITTEPVINLEGVITTRVTVRNIQFNEDITGLEIGQEFNKVKGCFDTSNEIDFSINYVNGGQISGQDGKSEFFFCEGDNVPDNVNLSFEGVIGQNSVIIVTDRLGKIVDIVSTNLVSFSDKEGGTFFIHNLAYNGDNFGLMLGQNITNVEGCFDFSNSISVIKSSGDPNAGAISTSINSTLCTGDTIPDIVDVQVENSGNNNSIWVFTDTEDNILDFPGIPPFDFSDSTGSSDIIIRYIDFTGIDNIRLGGNLSEIDGCFDISNPIVINRNGVKAGNITFRNESLSLIECVSSDDEINLEINKETSFGPVQHFLLLDDRDSILAILDEPRFSLNTMPSKPFKIQFISMLEDVEGLVEGNNISDIDGCFDLSNELILDFQSVTTTPSVISTSSATSLCLNDNINDIIEIDVLPGVGPLTSWVVTDPFGEILNIRQNGIFDLSDISGDENIIYNIKHAQGVQGIALGEYLSDIQGCYSISNPIQVTKGNNDGGELTFNGKTNALICLSDGTPPIIEVDLQNNFGQSSRFLITNPEGEIEKIVNSKTLDFEGLGVGTSMVYNVSFTSGINGIGISNNISEIEGCFDFSNPLIVDRYFIFGGNLSVNNNQNIIEICGGEGNVDFIDVSLIDNVSPLNQLLITDENGIIVALPASNNISFESGPTGNYYLYNIGYAEDVTNLTIGKNISELIGCYELSNAVTIKRSSVNGGSLYFQEEGTFYEACISTGEVQALTLLVENNSGNSLFIETTNDGEILRIFQDRIIDLTGIEPGQCRIYNISFFEVEGLEVGNNISQLTGCFSISNHVLIEKNEPKGGTLTDAQGNTIVDLCVGDNNTKLIDVRITGVSGPNSDWVLTDREGKILSTTLIPPFNLETNEMDQLNIYNIAYETGLIGLEKGNNINQLIGCYEFSNPIKVNNNFVESYSILVTESFKGERTMCIDDDEADILEIGTIGNVKGDQSRFVVTDEQGVIEEISPENVIDFSQYQEGISNVYQVSFLDGISGLDIAKNIANLEGCFSISQPIKVIRVGGAQCLTSTFQIDGKEIQMDLYPNPAINRVFVKMKGVIDGKEMHFSILDLTGRNHKSWRTIPGNNGVIEFNIDDLSSGIYFLNVVYNNEQGILKFIKE